jgi:hypothetical protein
MSLVTVGSRAKAVGRVVEQRFEDWMEKAASHLLGHAVSNCRNAEGTKLGLIFGDTMAS